jgi:hypothetical protein
MRALLLVICVVPFAACDSDIEAKAGTVEWMEWPAEVSAAMPFTVRLLVSRPVCSAGVFKPGVAADQSAVTFSPYFLVKRGDAVCLPTAEIVDIAIGALDTVGTAPGLSATYPRTFEMRAAAPVYVPAPSAADLPVRTFGQVTVRPSDPDGSRRNAAGFVFKVVDTLGCVRVQPTGTYHPRSALVLENQADTSGLTSAFVRGYIYEPAAPVCGEARVFHLVTRN